MLRQTLIVIVVCIVVVGLVVIVTLVRMISSCSARRHARPLPPVQPLAHYRQHQLAYFEATFNQPLSISGSKSSLLGIYSGECPKPAPEAESLLRPPPITHSSFAGQSKSLPGLRTDDQFLPHHHRPISLASSKSRLSSWRGLPHRFNSQVQVVMPAPLAPGVTPASSPRNLSDLDHTSIVDQWVLAGRDSTVSCTSTTSVDPYQIDQNQTSPKSMVENQIRIIAIIVARVHQYQMLSLRTDGR